MKRESGKLQRWTSISALASAALATNHGAGEAAIIFHPTPGLNIPRTALSTFLPLLGGKGMTLAFTSFRTQTTGPSNHRLLGPIDNPKGIRISHSVTAQTTRGVKGGGVAFRTSAGEIVVTDKGKTFNHVGKGSGTGSVFRNSRRIQRLFGDVLYYPGGKNSNYFRASNYHHDYTMTGHGYKLIQKGRVNTTLVYGYHFGRTTTRLAYSPSSFTDKFALFRFNVGDHMDYGWLELSLQNGFDFGSGPSPNVAILGYAYDTSGKPIPAGAVPEPKHLPLALAALALGSIGVRELRSKRRPAARLAGCR